MGLTVKYAHADVESGCSLRDVAAWQTQLSDPQEEATPDYILRVTEGFIQACPNRPELRDAHAIAGQAAADSGAAVDAIAHFEKALPLKSKAAQFTYTAALAVSGRDEAWDVRDEIIADWLQRVSYHPNVTLLSQPIRGGKLHRLTIAHPRGDVRIKQAWIAVPDGAGWPATLTIGTDRQRTMFHRLRAGEAAKPPLFIDLHRCTARRMIGRVEASALQTDIDQEATRALTAYLAAPDMTEKTDAGAPIASCVWPDRLLPEPGAGY